MQTITILPDTASVFAGTTIALLLKGIVLSYLQVRSRFRTRRYTRPEDARMMAVAPTTEPEIVGRIGEAWRNEVENGPIFLGLAVGFVLLGGAASPLLAVSIIFVSARWFQAYAQVQALQPHRTFAYLSGLASSIALAGFAAARLCEVMR
jgi:uncharacterized MAPEG superfamily protein